MHAMMRLADRFVVLDHGRGARDRAAARRGGGPSVIEAYLGKKWLARQNA